MKTPPILALGMHHVLVYVYGDEHFLQFRDGPHLVDSWRVTEEGLRSGAWDAHVHRWNNGELSWNALGTLARQIRSELSA